MQMIPGRDSGAAHLGNRLSRRYGIPCCHQQGRTMSVYRIQTTSMTDHDIISHSAVIACKSNGSIRSSYNRRTIICPYVDSFVVTGRPGSRRKPVSIITGYPCAARTRPYKCSSIISLFRRQRFRGIPRFFRSLCGLLRAICLLLSSLLLLLSCFFLRSLAL